MAMRKAHLAKWHPALAAITFILVCGLVVGYPVAAQAPVRGGTLLIGKEAEAVGLDPHMAIGFSVRELHELVYSSLVRVDRNLRVIPDLAESWEVPNASTYVFHVRKGVVFHNGREVTAADVKYSVERIMDPATKSVNAARFGSVTAIETPDKYTVRFVLKSPNAAFLADLAGGVGGPQPLIVAKEDIRRFGNLQRNMDGTGPFKLAEYIPDNVTRLVRNPRFYVTGEPYLDSIDLRIMPDESARVAALLAGQIHLSEIRNIENVKRLRGNPAVAVLSIPGTNFYALQINTKRRPFTDVRVRQAISAAINRQQVADLAVSGEGTMLGPVPPVLKDYALPAEELRKAYQPNIEKAKQLLQEAGFPQGFKTTIAASAQYPLLVTNAQIIQQQLRQIGIDAEIKLLEWGQYIAAWRARDYELMTGLDSFAADPNRMQLDFRTNGSANVYQVSDEKLDGLIDEGAQTIDKAKRREIYLEAQRRVLELAPKIYLYAPQVYTVIRREVRGYSQMPNEWRDALRGTWLEQK